MGTLEEGNRSEEFLKDLKYVWDIKQYKNKLKLKLFQTIIRTNIFMILYVLLLSSISMGLDIFQVIIFRAYIRAYEVEDPYFTTIDLGIAFLSAKLISTFINQQVNILQVNSYNN